MVARKNHSCFNDTNIFDFNNVSKDFSIHNIDNLKTQFNDLSKTMKNLENIECKSKILQKMDCLSMKSQIMVVKLSMAGKKSNCKNQ